MSHVPAKPHGTARRRIEIAAAKTELESIIRDSWAIADQSGDPRDAEKARAMEADARELLAGLPALRPKRKKSSKAKKRKAFKHGFRLNPDAPILTQVRNLGR